MFKAALASVALFVATRAKNLEQFAEIMRQTKSKSVTVAGKLTAGGLVDITTGRVLFLGFAPNGRVIVKYDEVLQKRSGYPAWADAIALYSLIEEKKCLLQQAMPEAEVTFEFIFLPTGEQAKVADVLKKPFLP